MHTRVYFEPFFALASTEVVVSDGINFHETEKYYHLHAYVHNCPLIAQRGDMSANNTEETSRCILLQEFDEWLKTKNCYVNIRCNSVILIFRDTMTEAEFRLRWC